MYLFYCDELFLSALAAFDISRHHSLLIWRNPKFTHFDHSCSTAQELPNVCKYQSHKKHPQIYLSSQIKGDCCSECETSMIQSYLSIICWVHVSVPFEQLPVSAGERIPSVTCACISTNPQEPLSFQPPSLLYPIRGESSNVISGWGPSGTPKTVIYIYHISCLHGSHLSSKTTLWIGPSTDTHY